MNRRMALTFAGTAAIVLTAGSAAVAANLGILGSASQEPVGQLDASTVADLSSTTTSSIEPIVVTIDEIVTVPVETPPETAPPTLGGTAGGSEGGAAGGGGVPVTTAAPVRVDDSGPGSIDDDDDHSGVDDDRSGHDEDDDDRSGHAEDDDDD